MTSSLSAMDQHDTGTFNGSLPILSHSDNVVAVVTVILTVNIAASLCLNILLIVVMQHSPSLQTPPNSNLVNICVNNLLLCANMLLCIITIFHNTHHLSDNSSKLLSGIQLFLTYNGLLQYWASFASIGYYRHRTIRKPSMSVKQKRQLVTRCVLITWLVSSILSLSLSTSFVPGSRYTQKTLDPFMRDFYDQGTDQPSNEEYVAICIVIFLALTIGLVLILKAYHSIWQAVRGVTSVGKNKISPRPDPFNQQADSSDLTLSTSRAYKPHYTLSSSWSQVLDASLTKSPMDTFVVAYACQDTSVTIESTSGGRTDIRQPKIPWTAAIDLAEDRVTMGCLHGHRKPLHPSMSSISSGSVKSKAPEFTDISIGADLLRFQREQSYKVNYRSSLRPRCVNMGSAVRNSVAMIVVYLTCSLPLITVTCPLSLSGTLSSLSRLHVIMLCRLLFFFNAPVYPIWFLVFSMTVRKCLNRLWEGWMIRWKETS